MLHNGIKAKINTLRWVSMLKSENYLSAVQFFQKNCTAFFCITSEYCWFKQIGRRELG